MLILTGVAQHKLRHSGFLGESENVPAAAEAIAQRLFLLFRWVGFGCSGPEVFYLEDFKQKEWTEFFVRGWKRAGI